MSSPAAMLKDLPLWTGLNREIDALRFAPTAKPLALSKLAPLDKTVTVDLTRLSPLLSEKPFRLSLFCQRQNTRLGQRTDVRFEWASCESGAITCVQVVT